jgi:Trypsin-like peptidase domain/Effector-associated domain 1
VHAVGYFELKGPDWKRISGALTTSFPSVDDLQVFIQQELPELKHEIAWGKAATYVVNEIVVKANARGQLDTLLAAASNERPFRPDLRAINLYYSRQPGWAAPVQAHDLDVRSTLQGLTTAGDPFLDTGRLALWLTRVERQVCLVRCAGSDGGTGFLVGRDLVLTCYHVVEQHLIGAVPRADVQVRFDYRRSAAGETPSYDDDWLDLDPSWTIPSARYSDADRTMTIDPAPDELDFALLKLAKPVGHETPAGEDRPRGWVDLSRDPALPAPSSPTLIVQHPQNPAAPPPQMPLQIAFAAAGFEGPNKNGSRLVYTPSTRPGSSGAPVFDQALRAFGLHHNRGQIDPAARDLVKNNRGVPLSKIRGALADGVRALLLAPP